MSKRPVILFYNDFWGNDPAADPPASCAADCEFTSDRSRYREADAVVFHIPTMPTWSGIEKLAHHKWVAWSMESNVYYPQLKLPAFMSRFDLTCTYKLDSDVPVLYLGPFEAEALRTPPAAKTASSPVVLFTSNSFERSGRTRYLEELARYLPVDSYGKHMRNRDLPEDKGRETKLATIARYKFTLAFENSLTTDYVSEKFYDPLIAGSVPVYLGAPNIEEFAPGEECFIDAAAFAGPRELAAYLKLLDGDEGRYAAYSAWKNRPYRARFLELVNSQSIDFRRRLCLRLRSIPR